MGYRGIKGLKGLKPILKAGGSGSGTVRGFNNDGTFIRRHNWTLDASRGYTVDAEPMDDEFDNYAEALNNCLTRDGTGKPTADLDYNGWAINNIAPNWANGASAVTLTQLVNQTLPIFYGTSTDNDAGTVITLDVLKSAQKVLPNEQTNRGYLFILVLNANVQNSSQYLKMQYAGNNPDISTYQIRWMDGGTFPAGTLIGGLPYLVFFRTAAIYIAPLAGGSNSGGGGGGSGGIQTLRSKFDSILIDTHEDILNPYIDANIRITTENTNLLHIAATYGDDNERGSEFVINNKYKLTSASEQIVVEDVDAMIGQQQVRFNPNFYSQDNSIRIQQLGNPDRVNFYSGVDFSCPDGTLLIQTDGDAPEDKTHVKLSSEVILGNFINPGNIEDNSLIIDNSSRRVLRAKVNPMIIPNLPSDEHTFIKRSTPYENPKTGVAPSLGLLKGKVSAMPNLILSDIFLFRATVMCKVVTVYPIAPNRTTYVNMDIPFWFSFGDNKTLIGEGVVDTSGYITPLFYTDSNQYDSIAPLIYCSFTNNNTIRYCLMNSTDEWFITAHLVPVADIRTDGSPTTASSKIAIKADNNAARRMLDKGDFVFDVTSDYPESAILAHRDFNYSW